jgi:hypothetical protein
MLRNNHVQSVDSGVTFVVVRCRGRAPNDAATRSGGAIWQRNELGGVAGHQIEAAVPARKPITARWKARTESAADGWLS